MFKIIYFANDKKQELEADTLDEILSACVSLFEQHVELFEIQENGECKYLHCEIYDLIKKAIY